MKTSNSLQIVMKTKFKSSLRAACQTFGGIICAGAVMLIFNSAQAQVTEVYFFGTIGGVGGRISPSLFPVYVGEQIYGDVLTEAPTWDNGPSQAPRIDFYMVGVPNIFLQYDSRTRQSTQVNVSISDTGISVSGSGESSWNNVWLSISFQGPGLSELLSGNRVGATGTFSVGDDIGSDSGFISGNIDSISLEVPEPTTTLLMSLGLAAFAVGIQRRQTNG